MGGRGVVSDVVVFAVDEASLLLPLLLLLLLLFVRIIGVGGRAADKSCCVVDVFVAGDWGGVINESPLIGEFNNDGFGISDVLLLPPLLLVFCLAGEADIIDVVDRRVVFFFFAQDNNIMCSIVAMLIVLMALAKYI